MFNYILLLHVLAATVWTGGHLILATTVLPRALGARDPGILLAFEGPFERVGMPALLIQVVSGLWMAYAIVPDLAAWFSFSTPPARLIAFKLALLAITVGTALDARLRVIPTLNAETLPILARRVVLVTAVSVLFVLVGVSFRGGLLSSI
ncbi:copper resistance protein CopD [Herbaspirillum sp. HC18]|nr:copper resistance protein CopD [Herbaspirillum sp. HC18]